MMLLLPLISAIAGFHAGAAEDRQVPYGCRTGTEVGLECGFGLGRLGGYLGAVTGTITLAVLAVVTLIVRWVRRRRDVMSGA